MLALGSYHSKDIHGWEGGSCTFHLLVKCSCKNCEADFDGFYSELKCSGEDYHSTHVLTCQFHALAYEIECTKRVILISLSPHLVFSQNLGPRTLICTWNTTMLQQIWGCFSPMWLGATGYHWIPGLYSKMGLPLVDGIQEMVRSLLNDFLTGANQGKVHSSFLVSLKRLSMSPAHYNKYICYYTIVIVDTFAFTINHITT